MKKTGIIYMATSPSGKSYIGQTIQKLNRRIQRHYRDAKTYSYTFANALKKYNETEYWQWTIVYNNIPTYQLNNMEKWCIANYNTYHNGYNSTSGGDSNPVDDPITREKISRALKGRKNPKQSLRVSGKNNPMYGKTSAMKGRKHTDEAKKKISNAKKGVAFSKEHKQNISKTHEKGEDHHWAKLTWKEVDEIRLKYATGNYTHRSLAKEYNIGKSIIGNIVTNKNWIK